MSSDSAWGIEPPKDAEGKVIPLDTDVPCSQSGKVFEVKAFHYSLKVKKWFVYGRYRGAERSGCGETDRFFLAPPDSWDKLIDDLRNAAERDIAACAYLSPEGKGCTKCQAKATRECTRTAFTDILSRIEKLRESDDE